VPGAEVKATQTATGVARTVASGPDGSFVLPSLPIGPYRLEVTKEGFARYLQFGIALEVNSNPAVDIALKVGAVSDQVQVEANVAQVETQETGVGQVIDNQRVPRREEPMSGLGSGVAVTDHVRQNFSYEHGSYSRACEPEIR